MSRTIRRTHCHLKGWYVSQIDDVDNWDLKRWNVNTPQQVVVRQAARFHSDAGTAGYHGGVPHWFRRRLNKRVDRANKAELQRCVAGDCWDDFLPHPHVANAGWYWW